MDEDLAYGKRRQYAEGVIARKQERNRLRHIKELSKQDLAISSEHLIPIPDPCDEAR